MPSSSLVEVDIEVEFETTFSVGLGWWVGGLVAGENRIKAISSSKLKLKLKMSLATNIMK